MKPESAVLMQQMHNNEATDQRVYEMLALRTKSANNRDTLLRIARDEAAHSAMWAKYTKAEPVVSLFRVWLYTTLARVFGLTFVINLMESCEEHSASAYAALASDVPEAARIREEEEEHEAALSGMIEEEGLSYISSMVLGLNDALVELTGALAGFTLALNNNTLVGMAGFITGVAATLSMAASEYLSKKADSNEKHPLKAACYTGVAYMLTVTLLLTPYLVLASPMAALGMCLLNAALIILGFTYFVSVVRKEPFFPAFREMICISFGVAAISFLIGWAARAWLNIEM